MPRNRVIPIFVPHAGCPHRCVFCDQRRIAGVGTPLQPEAVGQAIEEGLRCSGCGAEAAFYGGSFTAIPAVQQEALLSAVQPYLSAGQISSIRLSTRPDAIDTSVLRRLRYFGVKTVELGSQSMDDGVLRLCERGHNASDTVRAVSLLKESGFRVVLQMMPGLPGSNYASDLATAEQSLAFQPDGVRIYPTVVVRGTPLHALFLQGHYQPLSLDRAVKRCAVLFRMFHGAGIPVLRMGLQPSEELAQSVVAGPYHPAFGELVKSRILYEDACVLLDQTEAKAVTILVRKNFISAMTGQRRVNLLALREKYPEKTLKIAEGDCNAWEILLQSEENADKIT